MKDEGGRMKKRGPAALGPLFPTHVLFLLRFHSSAEQENE
jgi:hypothetical protein